MRLYILPPLKKDSTEYKVFDVETDKTLFKGSVEDCHKFRNKFVKEDK